MNVRELIEELKKYPGDMEVVKGYNSHYGGFGYNQLQNEDIKTVKVSKDCGSRNYWGDEDGKEVLSIHHYDED